MACLDTTLLVDLGRRQGARRQRARDKAGELVPRGERLVTTRVNVAELQVGVVFRPSDRAREEAAVAAVLTGLQVLDFGEESALIFGRATAHLQQIRRPAGDMDVLIGATALGAGELLVTRNPRHFADSPGLAVESY